MKLAVVAPLVLGCAAAAAVCCAPAPEEEGHRGTDPSGTAGGSGDGPDASAGPGGPGSGANGNLGPGGGSREGGTSGGLSADAACAATVLEPEAITVEETVETQIDCSAEAPEPINLYIVLDNSGSMSDSNKWQDAVTAITQFVQTGQPGAGDWTCVDQDGNSVPPPADLAPLPVGDISVAIQYFHPIDMGGGTDECSGSGHAVPAVAMTPIPANAGAIVSSLGSTSPGGNTPTVGALTGGTQYCAQFQTDNPGEKCIVVLVTDGQPNGCGLSSTCSGGFLSGGSDCVDPNAQATLTPIVQNAFAATNSVITFTVGMNGVTAEGFALLDAVAAAGGSDCTPTTPGGESCNVSTGGAQGFVDALNTIRQSVQATDSSTESVTNTVTTSTTLPCEWEVPSVPDGEAFDKDLVNVTVTIGTAKQELAQVVDAPDCDTAGGGWYYDDPADPRRILVCPGTCSTLESLTDTRVDVLFGCETRKTEIR